MTAFPIFGANCYWLSYCSSAARLPLLRSARAAGYGVIRAWAFPDGAPGWPERLDATVEDAEREGVRLILPLINHWPDFGGLGAPPDQFYRDGDLRRAYRERVSPVVSRLAGRAGVFAWELANEPRAERRVLVRWAREMAAHVKALDPAASVAVGDEGWHTRHLLEIDEIDFGTCHLYPDSWNLSPEKALAWIDRHVELGRRAGKPVVLEEFGLRDPAERGRRYPEWVRAAEAGGGSLVWMLGSSHPEVAGYRDEYTLYLEGMASGLT